MRDEHDTLWTASKCLDLRRFAIARGHEEDDGEEIYEPLQQTFRWMTKGEVPDASDIDVVYAQAKL